MVFLANDVRQARAESLLMKAAVRIAKNCASPGISELFDQFLGLRFAQFSEALIDGTDPIAFAAMERLSVACGQYARPFNRGLIAVKQLFAIAVVEIRSSRDASLLAKRSDALQTLPQTLCHHARCGESRCR
jgi:hypothetical protein